MASLEGRSYDLFVEAIEKPPSEWPEFLDLHCDSPELRAMVQRLLDLHVRSSEFLTKPAILTYPSLASPYGEQVAEFKIVRQIGKGGMGLVYLAEDTILKRPVALKIVGHANSDKDNGVAERLRREARAAARLVHPGIVQVYRTGEEEGFSFIAMEFVDGITLRDRLDSQRRVQGEKADPARFIEVARLISQVADALEHAHRASVVHRDVKPTNILLDASGHARLADFGIARITTEKTLLQTGTVVGSCAYMSPEQARVSVADIDHRTDVFSLGVVLYEAISFRRPFDGPNLIDVFKALADGRPAALRKVCPSVPVDLATICHKAIEHDVNHRYQTAAHMSADLRCFVDGHPILARPAGILRRTRIWVRSRQRSILLSCILLLTLAVAGIGASYRSAERSRMGLFVVAESHRGARVTVARYGGDLTLEAPKYLGRAPISAYLQPGMYRVTIDNGAMVLRASSLLEPNGTDTVEMNVLAHEFLSSLVPIPGGDYALGKPGSTYRLTTPRRVELPSFFISATEVSNREYREYVVATKDRPPAIWPDPYDPIIDDLPVTDVSWDEANRYCRWRGVRLPTPDEWEAAAQGPEGAAFPWGPSFSPHLRRQESEELDQHTYRRYARPVRSDPHLATPRGVMHMLSNVEEYTEGIALDRNRGIVVKGRSWADSPFRRPSDMFVLSSRAVRAPNRGFRVALSE